MTEPVEDRPEPERQDGSATTEAVEPGVANGRLAKALVGMYANGWCAAFSVAFLMLGGLTLMEGGGSYFVSCAAACLLAGYFSLSVGPFLCRWRASVPTPTYWPLSAALSAGLVLWTALSWSLLVLLVPYALGVGMAGTAAETVLLSLDRVMDGLGFTIIGLSWLAGMGACWLARHALSEDPPFVYTGATNWRKVLGLVLLIPYLLVMATAVGIAFHGRRLDPEIMAAYSGEIGAALEKKEGDSQTELNALPPELLESAPVKAWLAPAGSRKDKVDRKALVKAWCEQAGRLWTGAEFWTNPALVAMARLATDRHLAGPEPEAEGVSPDLLAELAVRNEVLMLEWGGVDSTQTQRLYDTSLDAKTWARLVDLGVSRTDLASSAALNDSDVRDRFVHDAARVLAKSDYDMDGKLQRRFFERCLERGQLNFLWEAYQKGKPYAPPGPPLGVDAFRRRYASSLDFDLNAIDEDISQATYREDVARQALAYDIVMMELKRLEAGNEPLPSNWELFRPPVAAIAKAYAEWMTLTPDGKGGVNLKRVDPHANGMSLTHRFHGPAKSG